MSASSPPYRLISTCRGWSAHPFMIQQDFRSSRALVRRTQGTLLRQFSKFIKKPRPGFQSVTKTGTFFFLTRVVVPRSLKTVKRLRLDSFRKKWGEKHPLPILTNTVQPELQIRFPSSLSLC